MAIAVKVFDTLAMRKYILDCAGIGGMICAFPAAHVQVQSGALIWIVAPGSSTPTADVTMLSSCVRTASGGGAGDDVVAVPPHAASDSATDSQEINRGNERGKLLQMSDVALGSFISIHPTLLLVSLPSPLRRHD